MERLCVSLPPSCDLQDEGGDGVLHAVAVHSRTPAAVSHGNQVLSVATASGLGCSPLALLQQTERRRGGFLRMFLKVSVLFAFL